MKLSFEKGKRKSEFLEPYELLGHVFCKRCGRANRGSEDECKLCNKEGWLESRMQADGFYEAEGFLAGAIAAKIGGAAFAASMRLQNKHVDSGRGHDITVLLADATEDEFQVVVTWRARKSDIKNGYLRGQMKPKQPKQCERCGGASSKKHVCGPLSIELYQLFKPASPAASPNPSSSLPAEREPSPDPPA